MFLPHTFSSKMGLNSGSPSPGWTRAKLYVRASESASMGRGQTPPGLGLDPVQVCTLVLLGWHLCPMGATGTCCNRTHRQQELLGTASLDPQRPPGTRLAILQIPCSWHVVGAGLVTRPPPWAQDPARRYVDTLPNGSLSRQPPLGASFGRTLG